MHADLRYFGATSGDHMNIAYTMTQGRGDLDRMLTAFAEALGRQGVRACGIVQINTDRPDSHRCDMDVQVLPDGPMIRISHYLGKEAQGCALNPDAMEQAVAEVARQMEKPFDIFLLNKFGKHESGGRGFRDLIGEALAQGKAVVVGANGMNVDVFQEFAGGMAEFVEPDIDALLAWYKANS